MSVNEKDENKLNIGNANINTSLINDINKNSSIHSLVFNIGFSSYSTPNIRRANSLNDLNINYDNSIGVDRARSNEISDDGLIHNMLRNGSATSGGTFHLKNFDLNEFVISNNNSNIIVNPETEFKINPFQNNDICKQKNNNNKNNMNRGAKIKVIEKNLLRKELNLIKKEKELDKKEKAINGKADELDKKEKAINAKADELDKKEKNIDVKTKELNQLIEKFNELKILPKIEIEKIKVINLKDEDEKENLTQQEIFTKKSIEEKEENQEIEKKNVGNAKTIYNDEMTHHGDNQIDNIEGEKKN